MKSVEIASQIGNWVFLNSVLTVTIFYSLVRFKKTIDMRFFCWAIGLSEIRSLAPRAVLRFMRVSRTPSRCSITRTLPACALEIVQSCGRFTTKGAACTCPSTAIGCSMRAVIFAIISSSLISAVLGFWLVSKSSVSLDSKNQTGSLHR